MWVVKSPSYNLYLHTFPIKVKVYFAQTENLFAFEKGGGGVKAKRLVHFIIRLFRREMPVLL
jgi:hypothetical protein